MNKILSIGLSACLIFAVGCGGAKEGVSQESSRTNPISINQTVSYNSMSLDSEYESLAMDITLQDIQRVSTDQLKDFYYSEVDVPNIEDKELLLLQFNVDLIESYNESKVDFSYLFYLISQDGKEYPDEYFSFSLWNQLTLGGLYPGSSNAGLVGFLVDKTDTNPVVGFNTDTSIPMFFIGSLSDEQRSQVTNPIDLSYLTGEVNTTSPDSGEDPSESSSPTKNTDSNQVVGTIKNPIPKNTWGLYENSRDDLYYGKIEMRLLNMVQGEEAEKLYGDTLRSEDGQTLVAFQLEINLLDFQNAHNNLDMSNDFGSIYSYEVVNDLGRGEFRSAGTTSPASLLNAFAPSSQTGWLFTWTDSPTDNYKISLYVAYDSALWFSTSTEGTDPNQYYTPTGIDNIPSVDTTHTLGSKKNPAKAGETIESSYNNGDHTLEYSIQLNEVLTGEAAYQFLQADGATNLEKIPEGYQYVVLSINAHLKENDRDSAYIRYELYENNLQLSDSNMPYIYSAKNQLKEIYISEQPTPGYVFGIVPTGTTQLLFFFNFGSYSESGSWFLLDLGGSTPAQPSSSSSNSSSSEVNSSPEVSSPSSSSSQSSNSKFIF